ncbi:MAG: MBL fold metallo-hydrolase [Ferruginibacter sp.]
MALFITSLNSGSNGNCYYIGNNTEAVLIDAGISCRETEKRMRLLGLSMKTVKAIFVSHEHIDHIKGVPLLAEKYKLPVYITTTTLMHSGIHLSKDLSKTFKAYEQVQIGNLLITGFPKFHDAEDPHSFIINYDGITVGVFTDIGAECSHVTKNFSQCHAAFLETNYDEVLLENGRYPIYLKNRIRGGKGHLSNTQALEIFVKHKPSFMTHLFLSHLSRDNNAPEIAKQLFDKHAGKTEIIVASRYEQTAVYTIQKQGNALVKVKKRQTAFKLMQLSLFE